MTCEATSSRGTGKPRSRADACMHFTIVDVLSINVPSQSKTIKSNCFLAMSSDRCRRRLLSVRLVIDDAAGLACRFTTQWFPQAYQESLTFGGQRCVQR